MRFQVCSDLHLEFYPDSIDLDLFLVPTADYLIVPGDICPVEHPNFQRFFDYFSPKFQEIFFVAGNHEYYTDIKRPVPIDELTIRMRRLLDAYDNVHFLNGETFTLFPGEEKEVIILGTTLWSCIPDEYVAVIQLLMNDYLRIWENTCSLLRPYDINCRYKIQKEWLQSTLKSLPPKTPAIVITHHLPSYSLINEKYAGNPINCAFASHLDEIFHSHPQIKAWVYGHTHTPRRDNIGSALTICNPKGYPDENESYCLTNLFEVDVSTVTKKMNICS